MRNVAWRSTRRLCLVVIAVAFFTAPAWAAKDLPKSCENILLHLGRAFGNGVAKIIFKDMPQSEGGMRKWHGVLRSSAGKPYRFTPIKALTEAAIERPVAGATAKIFGKPKAIRKWLTLSASVASMFLIGAPLVERTTHAAYEHRIEQEAASHADRYDRLIDHDFRYREVKAREKSGLVDRAGARREAYLIDLAYEKYFEYLSSETAKEAPEKALERLENHYLFLQFKTLFENGLAPMEGYDIPASRLGRLSLEQKLEIVKTAHRLYFEYEFVWEWFANGNRSLDPELLAFGKRIEDEPFVQELQALVAEGKLKPEELVFRIQEDAHWRAKFEHWRVLGIKRLQQDEQGNWMASPLTLDQIRSETLEELLR